MPGLTDADIGLTPELDVDTAPEKPRGFTDEEIGLTPEMDARSASMDNDYVKNVPASGMGGSGFTLPTGFWSDVGNVWSKAKAISDPISYLNPLTGPTMLGKKVLQTGASMIPTGSQEAWESGMGAARDVARRIPTGLLTGSGITAPFLYGFGDRGSSAPPDTETTQRTAAFGRAIAEQAKGLAEFTVSDLGLATIAAGGPIAGAAAKVLPWAGRAIKTLISAGFTADIASKAPDQYEKWLTTQDHGTPAEKVVATVELVAALGMLGMTTLHAATGAGKLASPVVEAGADSIGYANRLRRGVNAQNAPAIPELGEQFIPGIAGTRGSAFEPLNPVMDQARKLGLSKTIEAASKVQPVSIEELNRRLQVGAEQSGYVQPKESKATIVEQKPASGETATEWQRPVPLGATEGRALVKRAEARADLIDDPGAKADHLRTWEQVKSDLQATKRELQDAKTTGEKWMAENLILELENELRRLAGEPELAIRQPVTAEMQAKATPPGTEGGETSNVEKEKEELQVAPTAEPPVNTPPEVTAAPVVPETKGGEIPKRAGNQGMFQGFAIESELRKMADEYSPGQSWDMETGRNVVSGYGGIFIEALAVWDKTRNLGKVLDHIASKGKTNPEIEPRLRNVSESAKKSDYKSNPVEETVYRGDTGKSAGQHIGVSVTTSKEVASSYGPPTEYRLSADDILAHDSRIPKSDFLQRGGSTDIQLGDNPTGAEIITGVTKWLREKHGETSPAAVGEYLKGLGWQGYRMAQQTFVFDTSILKETKPNANQTETSVGGVSPTSTGTAPLVGQGTPGGGGQPGGARTETTQAETPALTAEAPAVPPAAPPVIPPEAPPITPPTPPPIIPPLGDYERPPGSPIGIKNAEIDKLRAEMGMEPIAKAAGLPDKVLWQRVMDRIEQDPHWIDTVISDIKKTGRGHTNEEALGLNHRLVETRTEFYKESRKAAKARDAGDTVAEAQAKVNVNFWSDKLVELEQIVTSSGSTLGSAFRARQFMMDEDFSLAALELKKRKAKDWAPLNDAERAEIAKTHAEYVTKTDELKAHLEEQSGKRVDAEIKLAAAEAARGPEYDPQLLKIVERVASFMDKAATSAMDRITQRRKGGQVRMDPSLGTLDLAADLVDASIIGAAKIARKINDFTKWSDAMVKQVGDWVIPHLKDVWESSKAQVPKSVDDSLKAEKPDTKAKAKAALTGQDVAEKIEAAKDKIQAKVEKGQQNAIFYQVQELVRAIVERDPKIARGPLINEVHGVLKEFMPDVEKMDTMDAISGVGRFNIPKQDIVSRAVRELKTQTRLASHFIRVLMQEALPRTGYQHGKLSDVSRNLTTRINKAKRKFPLEPSDPESQLGSILQSRKTYYTNRMADLQAEIKAGKRRAKTTTPSPTDPELDALIEEYTTVKREHDEIFGRSELTEAQKLERLEKSATRQIVELERQVKMDEVFAKTKQPSTLSSEKLVALRSRIEALKVEREYARERIQPKPEEKPVKTERENIETKEKALDRRIAELQRQLDMNEVFAKSKRESTVTSEGIVAKKARIDALVAERDYVRMRAEPDPAMDPFVMAIIHARARIARKLADYTQRVADGDYAPRTKKPPVDITQDKQAMSLMADLQKVKRDFDKGLALDEAKKRSGVQKLLAGTGEVLNIPRALWSSFDLSAVGRQGAIMLMGHPIRSAKSIIPMFKALFSEKAALIEEQKIINRPNYQNGNYAKSGLYLASLDEFRLNRQEELQMSHYSNLIPGVRASNRAFMTYLNKLRADSFDVMLQSRERWFSKPVEQFEKDAIANYINISTGRGYLGNHAAAAQTLATIFWAPRLMASRIQYLGLQPLLRYSLKKGGWRTTAMIGKEYAQTLMGMGAVIGLAKLAGADIETDRNSSDFLKLKFGNARVDIMGGLFQNVVFVNRLLISGKIKTASGKEKPVKAGPLIWDFARNKFTPLIGTGLDVRDLAFGQKPPAGHPQTLGDLVLNLPVPLSFRDVFTLLREEGVPATSALTLVSLFGWGVQYYDALAGEKPSAKPNYPDSMFRPTTKMRGSIQP